jgi:protein-S-isoprenylcysteine O-methyltransferase Ste14
VRHPLYVGGLMLFWATPHMTASHLVFSLALTAYVLAAIRREERDLLEGHLEYADYKRSVPMLWPRFLLPSKKVVGGQARDSSSQIDCLKI